MVAYNVQMPVVIQRGLRYAVGVAVGLLVVGCAGKPNRPPVTEVTRIPENGDWFCQQSASGQGWDCVQDPELAAHPKPERVPEPAQAPARAPEPASVREPPQPTGPSQNGDTPAAEVRPLPADEPPSAPARQPDDVADLLQRPRDHWAVQLMATATRAELERFIARHGLEQLPSVVVEREGRLFHVLLLGVFPTLEDARRAAAERPPSLDRVEPWIRPMGSLQSAIGRAELLAGSGGA